MSTIEFKVDLEVDTLEKLKVRVQEFLGVVENKIAIANRDQVQPKINFFAEEANDGSESVIVIHLS